MEEKLAPLASEIYADLKESNMFLRKLLIGALAVIAILVIALVSTSIYHDYRWSQFDTIVVDSEGGNANYVGGENYGGINNGSDSSKSSQEKQQD